MPPTSATLFGRPTPRIDGVAKVTGAARYASDELIANPAFAYLVTSSIARGRITGFTLDRARAVPGVLDILTYQNVGAGAKLPQAMLGGPTTTTIETDQVWHAGQIVAIVVADTFEAAREAANAVEVAYAAETPSATFGSPGVTIKPHEAHFGPDPQKGDAAAAFAASAVTIDARYATPTQHHNTIELFTTTCIWDGPKLTVYEPTQFMVGSAAALAEHFDMKPADVRFVSHFIGGAFGSKGSNGRTAWIAVAAKRVGRPVKFVPTRDQCFTIATYRAETQQHVKLSADADGKLTSLFHEGWEVTSRPSDSNVAGVGTTARMYACDNIATAVNVVNADRATPGFMRAPPETPYMFGLESAIDELAYALDMDPVELRRRNDTQVDPASGLPFSSRSLMACFDAAAERFGWSARDPKPASMRDGEWLVGYGCATACYPSNTGPAAARVSLDPQGKAVISLAGHEIGNGAYTAVAITVARSLGIAVDDVTVHMGDSELPPVILAGGSSNTTATAHVAVKACEEIRRRIAEAAVSAADGPLHGADPATVTLGEGKVTSADGQSEPLEAAVGRLGGHVEVYAEYIPDGEPSTAMADLYKGKPMLSVGSGRKDVTAYAFGAHFVEVRVHSRTREIRVPRVVSAFAAGTIVNPLTAHSQYMGGVIWGLSSALFEETELDLTAARYVNNNLADYMVPVNADVPSIDIIMVPEADDRVNPLGIKGIGEVGIVGVNAAVANAVYHATAIRIRELPIRAEKLL